MSKYKVSASKDQKKYSFVFSASSTSEAKQRVHDKGYSILSVEELDDTKLKGKKIIFKAVLDGENKSGKVIGNDLFKIYLRLKDGLKYDIKELYFEDDKDESQEEKNKLLTKIVNQYNLFYELNSKKTKTKTKSAKFKDKEEKNETHTENFYLKKELEENYKLLNFVLEKLRKLLDNKEIKEEKKHKLQNIYNSLILLKTSTNIGKIKKVGETALLKIGEIELELLENTKDDVSRKVLKETNFLLKKVGSKAQFKEKDKDISYIIKNKIEILSKGIKNYIISLKTPRKTIDERSTFYLSTLLSINSFKKKLSKNNIKIIKNIIYIIFPFGGFEEKKDRILIERRLINSKLILLKSKINKNNFSYTKVKRGYKWFIDLILLFFENIRQYLFLVILFYSLLFVSILFLSYYNIFNLNGLMDNLNYRGIFYFIQFLFIYFAMYFSRGLWTLLINFILVFIVVIFGLINF